MERIKAYSTPSPDGGVTVDIEGMLVDLITIVKAGGITKKIFLDQTSKTFDEVEVMVTIPDKNKN